MSTTGRDWDVPGRSEGVAVYETDPLYALAVRDDGGLVVSRGE